MFRSVTLFCAAADKHSDSAIMIVASVVFILEIPVLDIEIRVLPNILREV
jgi:hypothetical protein